MRIWIIEIGEPLPIENEVRLLRYGQFTKALASYGHEVTWWASSFSHAPKEHFADKDTDIIKDGVVLRLVHGPGYKKNISLARIKHHRYFARRFSELAEKHQKPNLLIATIPAVEIAHSATQFAQKYNIPILIDIRDLWPDELTDLAPSPVRPFARLILRSSYQAMEDVCKTASGILAVAERYLDYGLRFAGRKKSEMDYVFPLTYSPTPSTPLANAQAHDFCRHIGINEDAFIICFFGTIGQYFDLSTPIEAARILSQEFPVQFVFGGDGSKLRSYQKEAQQINSVLFPGWLNQPEISAVMSKATVGLAPYKTEAKMSLPNKPFEYMASRLPVISSIQGELRELIERHRCGVSYNADSAEELCQAIRLLHSDYHLREEMGRNAFALWDNEFRSEKVFEAAHRHLQSVTEQV